VLHVRRGTHQQSGRRGEQGATSVRAYFPGELWYDYFTHAPATNGKATWLTLRAPLDTIPVRCR
jgi:alpha-glucosidase (family GH31 glycosyl hydrolase)